MVSAPHQGYANQGDETFLEQVLGQELMIQVDYLAHTKDKLDGNRKC